MLPLSRYCLLAILLLPAFIQAQQSSDIYGPQTLLTPPANSHGPTLGPEQPYLLEEIQGGLWWLTDGHYQMMFLVTDAGVVVFDAPGSLAAHIKDAVASVTPQPITHLVYSHFHKDHIGAAAQIASGIEIIAHKATRDLLELDGDTNRPLPSTVFDKDYRFSVGGRAIELHYPGPNHDVGNIIMHVPHARTAMMVDVVWPGWVPFHSIGVADHIPGVFRAMDTLLAMDFDFFVGGHANRFGRPSDIRIQREYLSEVRNAAQQAYKDIDLPELIQRYGWEHRWHIFDVYFEKMSGYCNDVVVPRWVDRLGDANRFTRANCLAMALSLWMD